MEILVLREQLGYVMEAPRRRQASGVPATLKKKPQPVPRACWSLLELTLP